MEKVEDLYERDWQEKVEDLYERDWQWELLDNPEGTIVLYKNNFRISIWRI